MSDNYFRALSDSEGFIPGLSQSIGANGDIMSKGEYYIYPDNTEKSFSPGATIVANQVRLLLNNVFKDEQFIGTDGTKNKKEEKLLYCKKYIKEHKEKYS